MMGHWGSDERFQGTTADRINEMMMRRREGWGNTLAVTFSKEEGLMMEKQTRNTSVYWLTVRNDGEDMNGRKFT